PARCSARPNHLELETEGICPKARAREAVGSEIALEVLDEILGLPALLVPGEDLLGRAVTIGDDEAKVMSLRGPLHLGQDTARRRPTAGLVKEARVEPRALARALED